MAKRKGSSSTSSPRARKKAAEEGSKAKSSEGGGVEDESGQLRGEVRALSGKRTKLSEQQRNPEEQLRPLRLEEEQLQQNLLMKRACLADLCSAREAENAQRLAKLPQEVWEKIFDELVSDDLFPLALSCRYFRQKQKELVARTRQNGKPCLALKTTLHEWLDKHDPASAAYLRFCYNEKVSCDYFGDWDMRIRVLAAFHGHLPLLQELHAGLGGPYARISRAAVRGGQLETLQWLNTQKGFELIAWLFNEACRAGNLEIMKWLRSEGCPWGGEMTVTYAAAQGHLEILKWLRSEGCPWNAGTWHAAKESTREWLEENGCPQEYERSDYDYDWTDWEDILWENDHPTGDD